MNQALKGKVVLVTGGGIRLGKALALGLANAGAHVAVHFHGSRDGAEEVVRDIQAKGGKAAAFQADLQSPSSAAPLVKAAEQALGPLDALVNSAGIFHRAEFLETKLEVLEGQWALNARAPFLLTQAAARGMVARGKGDVVNLVDIGGGLIPWSYYSAYCMSKAALAMLTQALALELAPHVRVNGVMPGSVLPPENWDPSLLETLRERIPQQRFGSAQDVVDTALFLLTGPQFLTGQLIAVDGGRSLGMAHA